MTVDYARKQRSTRSPIRIPRRLGYLILGGASFILGILAFNYVVMPAFVQHGKDVAVPDLAGKPLAYAEGALQHADLKLGDLSRRFETRTIEGTVIAQSPRGGTRIKEGGVVSLVISAGEEATQVPGLVGEYLDNARQILEKQGLRVGRVSHTYSAEDPPDRILASDPAPSSSVPRSSDVNLLVSLGPETEEYRMPDLRGFDPELARARLEQAGFLVEVRYVAVRGRGEHHSILRQEPSPGAKIKARDTIVLEAE